MIPGNGTLPWDDSGEAPSLEELRAYADRVGARIDVPQGARALGCVNCLSNDRLRWPQMGMVYCHHCPVSRRQRALEQNKDLTGLA